MIISLSFINCSIQGLFPVGYYKLWVQMECRSTYMAKVQLQPEEVKEMKEVKSPRMAFKDE